MARPIRVEVLPNHDNRWREVPPGFFMEPWLWGHPADMKNPPTKSGGVIVKCIGVLPRLRAGAKGGQQANQVIKANGA